MQHLSEIAEEITLNWNLARMLSLVLLILQKKNQEKKKLLQRLSARLQSSFYSVSLRRENMQ